MAIANAADKTKTVAAPNAKYESLKPLWNRSRAVCGGERFVKDFDNVLDTMSFTNLLIPFSPSMTPAQYKFYKAEAELPGITAQFAKMLVGGLLRKQPVLTLPDDVPEEAQNWIMNNFGQDDSPMTAFLDAVLWEEIQTGRSWVHIDYPNIENYEKLDREDMIDVKPYPVLWDAESVINWRVGLDGTGRAVLNRVIKRGYVEVYSEENEFHPAYLERVWVHELDESGYYQIRVYDKKAEATSVPVISGREFKNPSSDPSMFELVDTISDIMYNGERLSWLPIWPVNGSHSAAEPPLISLIDKEIALYNKISRRNHLLYGAATYTPIIMSDTIGDEGFQDIVEGGLGSWIHLGSDDKASVLDTPTDALTDMDRAISNSIEEMAKLGVRMLSPETAQSGVALEIRNAAQTAQMGTLNSKISNVFAQIIVFMLNWRYDTEYTVADVEFSLSSDFNPVPIGADWLRLATEWYETGIIPRSVWLSLLKHNDLLAPDYEDEEGQLEINGDKLIQPSDYDQDYVDKLKNEQPNG